MSKSTSKMTPAAASRIQSSTTKSNSGTTPKGSFASIAQSSAAKNSNSESTSPKTSRKK